MARENLEELAQELREFTATEYTPCAVEVKIDDDSIWVCGLEDKTVIHPVDKVVFFALAHGLNVICSQWDGVMYLWLF